MNKFRNVPALITLLAGFITSVIMIVHRYSLVNFMWILIAVMVGFYICGVLIRFALNKDSDTSLYRIKRIKKIQYKRKNRNRQKNKKQQMKNNSGAKARFMLLFLHILLFWGH